MSFVYFARAGDSGRIKIGLARDVSRRLLSLRTGCPFPLTLMGVIAGGQGLERSLHRKFEANRVDGLREWFYEDPALLAFIAEKASVDGRRDEALIAELLKDGRWPLGSSAAQRAARRILETEEGLRGMIYWDADKKSIAISGGVLTEPPFGAGNHWPESIVVAFQDYLAYKHDLDIRAYNKLYKMVKSVAWTNGDLRGVR